MEKKRRNLKIMILDVVGFKYSISEFEKGSRLGGYVS